MLHGQSFTELPSEYIRSSCFCPLSHTDTCILPSAPSALSLSSSHCQWRCLRGDGNVHRVGELKADWNPYYLCSLPPWPVWNTITCDYLCFTKYNLFEGSKENTKICPRTRCSMSPSTGIHTSLRTLVLQNIVGELWRIHNSELWI